MARWCSLDKVRFPFPGYDYWYLVGWCRAALCKHVGSLGKGRGLEVWRAGTGEPEQCETGACRIRAFAILVVLIHWGQRMNKLLVLLGPGSDDSSLVAYLYLKLFEATSFSLLTFCFSRGGGFRSVLSMRS